VLAGAWLQGQVLRHSMEVRQGRRRLGVGGCSMAQERHSEGAMGERERERWLTRMVVADRKGKLGECSREGMGEA